MTSKRVNWQQQATDFAEKHNLNHNFGVNLVDLLSELGEVGKEWLIATEYGEAATEYGEAAPKFRPEMVGELGDLLYSLCLLASSAEIDLDIALKQTLAKYEARWQATNQIGSGAA